MTAPWSVRSITRTLLPLLLVLSTLELAGGITLGVVKGTFLRYPSLLVLVPVTIGTAGNLGSILSAHLSTSFHLGTLSFDSHDEQLLGNAITTVCLALTVFPLVGLGAWAVTSVAGTAHLDVWTVLGVAVVSGFTLAGLTIVVAVSATYLSYRLELDPDDVVIPVVTNVCDVLGVLVLIGVVQATVG